MKKYFFASAVLILPAFSSLHATNLSLGADYLLRGVSIEERDKTLSSNRYYDQRLQAYLVTDLSKDVEATVRVQSINVWGLEGSTNPLSTRYPDANGDLWVQNAFVRLPGLWKDRIIVTAGRQPLVWGDGAILSDDELGMNAIRMQIKSPWRRLPFDIDGFTAKISETLTTNDDTNLHGAVLGFNREAVRWEIMGLWEKSGNAGAYEMGAETTSVISSNLERKIYGVRAKANLRDAFLRGEYYVQKGSLKRNPNGDDITLGGDAFIIGLGGKQNTEKFGRFGAILEVATGSGDDANTLGEDEAFRPTFASRWSGLERRGYGRYFAATLSDAYSPSSPFAPASSVNDGLPEGISGIQSVHFGIEATPWSQWTFSLDYFQYKGQKALAGKKDLGTEFDYGLVYRHSGLVQVRANTSSFDPGEAFDELTRQKASWSSLEIDLKF